jgi:hypothetical protein
MKTKKTSPSVREVLRDRITKSLDKVKKDVQNSIE